MIYESEQQQDEKPPRILSDEEYSQYVTNREDVFLVENQTRLTIILAASLILAVFTGLWLNVARVTKIPSDFYQKILVERSARLLRMHSVVRPEESVGDIPATDRFAVKISAPAARPKGAAGEAAESPMARKVIPTKKKIESALAPVIRGESIAPSAEALPTEADTALISRGDMLKKQGNRSEAFAAFRRALAQNPHDARALSGMGDLFLYTGILDSAANFYYAALAANPRKAAVHKNLGSVHYFNSSLGENPNYDYFRNIKDPKKYVASQYDSAIAEYTAAIALDSTGVDALTNRGVLRDIKGDYDGALEDYSIAIRIRPAYADAYAKRAATFKTLGKYLDARADYTAAIKLDTASYEFDPALHFANAYFGRGSVEYRMGMLVEAVADFDSALAINPAHSLAIISKAVALSDQKLYDSAIVVFTKGISFLSPKEYNGAQKLAYLQRGNAFKALGKYDRAIEDYEKALDAPRLAAKSSWRIAECYCLKKDAADALAWLRKSAAYGFSDFAKWKKDPDLSPLWNSKQLREITGS